MVRQINLIVKLDLQDAYFNVPYKRIRENQVSVGGQPIRISMPLPWLRPSPKNFHEVAEDSHCINTENKRQAYHLPRQYLKNGENPAEILMT